VAFGEKIVHPLPARDVRHDSLGVGKPVCLGDLEFFLAFADLFAIGAIEGH